MRFGRALTTFTSQQRKYVLGRAPERTAHCLQERNDVQQPFR